LQSPTTTRSRSRPVAAPGDAAAGSGGDNVDPGRL
jgi:hypothetical protein